MVTQLGLFNSLGAATALAVLAAVLSRRTADPLDDPLPALLTPAALRRPPSGLPNPSAIRREIGAILRAPGPQKSAPVWSEPESAAQALRRAFARILQTWGVRSVDELDADQLQALWQLRELVNASPSRAGELAQTFRKPDVVLAIRDRIAEVDARHLRFKRQAAAYHAAKASWSDRHAAADTTLLDSLRAQSSPDPDLWHKVIAEHDPADPAQARAALWCAGQPACERASVALYFTRIAKAERIDIAARDGDTDWLAVLREVIRGWNEGRHGGTELGLEPADAAARAAPSFAAALDRLAERTGEDRWPDPRGAFAEYHGATARPRTNWDLAAGRMTAPPRIADYIDIEGTQPA